ncbi:hypothetical protein [Amycolatopsis sp. NBC_00438]|uniref:hypothetical protein n=1 Tax=Amycolatopsis sp. NBC_00438 TaxID=2903558 RepID=UPI002E1CA51D
MTDHPRRVTLHSQHRSVTLGPQPTGTDASTDTTDHAGVSYAGILVSRICGDSTDSEFWLPIGETASYADDEKLITVLHQALRWTFERP